MRLDINLMKIINTPLININLTLNINQKMELIKKSALFLLEIKVILWALNLITAFKVTLKLLITIKLGSKYK